MAVLHTSCTKCHFMGAQEGAGLLTGPSTPLATPLGHRFSHPEASGKRKIEKKKVWGYWVRDRILVQNYGGIR